MGKHEPLTNRERVARRRAALRAQGLRPKQIWVPDVRRPGFWEEIQSEMAAIAASDREREDLAFVESLIDWDSAPPYDAPLPD
ncbi:MAG: hypothetical protein QOJ53_1433 [Sphingomonadales bacterium]|jgi:hypothetical protein|nr:hypothetical protein [Sphingomonadales bacterium]